MKERTAKIMSQAAAVRSVKELQSQGLTVVFTNGCFDLLHVGHVRYLRAARNLGDALIVAVNSDRSVRVIKGNSRPLTPEDYRLEVLAALEAVPMVCLFGEETPLRLIRKIGPDIIAKGGDWPVEKIVGREYVEKRGGQAVSIPLVQGISTTDLIQKMKL